MRKAIFTRNLVFVLLPLVVAGASLFLGRYPLPPGTLLRVLLGQFVPLTPDWNPTIETVIFNIRLPRILLGMLIGGGLSISGAAFQGMFQNPLVSPDILGVTTGAGFGAALAILLSGSTLVIQVSALSFGILAVLLSYLISRVYKTTPVLMLVLSGIVVGAIFSALISLVKYVADPNQKLPAIVFWLMGSLAAVSKRELAMAAPPIMLGSVGLLLLRWRINLLSLGDEEARSLGVRTEILKAAVVICCTLATAAAVSVCGVIGWVGLVVPHVGRMLVGPDHRILLPVSFALGATYLVLVDDLARSLISAEIPLGILTAIIGAPFFALMLRRTQAGGWRS